MWDTDTWDTDADPEVTKTPLDARTIRRRLSASLRKAEHAQAGLAGTPLGDNLGWLATRLGLSPVEVNILALVVLYDGNKPFSEAVNSLRLRGTRRTVLQMLSIMTAAPLAAVTEMLSIGSTLPQSGLLRLDTDAYELDGAFTLPAGLADALMSEYQKPEDLLLHFFCPGLPPKLAESDFAHLDKDIRLLKAFLAQALLQRESGVNILLYGEPGVGKSELARFLGASAGATVVEVNNADQDGDALSGQGRFSSFMLSQHMLAKSGDSVVLFDEIEDVFPSSGAGLLRIFGMEDEGKKGAGKAWVNRVLETNPVPAIWIANKVGHIDPAYLRRFDYALEVPRPPRAARLRIAQKYFGATKSSPDWVDRIADWGELTPAQLEKAARLARLVKPRTQEDAEHAAERTLRLSARLLGQEIPTANQTGAGYRLDCLNANLDVAKLIAGLNRRPRASLCFYGPPGTGKTALARHIAQALDRPLLVKRASDLLSKWVGEAEKNISAMFREASEEGAVLVLDEADGLLADRRDAQQSWEVTQVNEMLTHMEDFQGLFVCTTNLLEKLDQASLRRFSFKIKFGYLKPAQSLTLFEETWRRLNPDTGMLDASLRRRLSQLENLTPGDFATVARQWTVLGEAPDAGALLIALENECRVKGGVARRIGFGA